MKGKSRRREVRKSIPRSHRSLRELVGRSQVLWSGLLMGLFIVAAGWLAVVARDLPAYRSGQLVDRAVVSRVSFESVDLGATEQARRRARDRTPGIYRPNTAFLEETWQRLAKLPEVVAAAEVVDGVAGEVRRDFGLDEAAFEALREHYQDEEVSERWRRGVDAFMEALRRRPILTGERYQIEVGSLAPTISLRVGEDTSVEAYGNQLVNQEDAEQLGEMVEELGAEFSEPVRRAIVQYLRRAEEAVYEYDRSATEEAREEAAEAIEPQVTDYEPNQTIIEAGTRLDDDGYALLKREHEAYLGSLPPGLRWGLWAGPVGLVVLVTLGLAVCVMTLRPRIASNPMRGLALAGLLLVTLTIAWLGPMISPAATTGVAGAAVGTAALAAVILSIAYDQRFAVAVAVLHAMLIALVLDLTVGLYLVTLAACVVIVLQVSDVRQRGALIRGGFVTGLVAAGGVFAAGVAERQFVAGLYPVLVGEAALAFGAALAVGFFVLGVLPFIERAFKVTTAMTLLELCDVNQPLLRRLAQRAPGTYNHSLQVGTLAEAAAEAIGADSLLTRVGAYYHDIGKMNKPHYFVENQLGGANPHEKVSPAMSLLIIVGHVKDGVELAREYALPPVLHHFIESHHGTTLVEYFYHAARRGKDKADQPEEVEYRYPGPKPQTREAAILMLCDTVESASRSLADPTATRIEHLVNKLATKRLVDGQFDHCNITFAELKTVEEAITKSLTAIYHGRIAYPSGRPEPAAAVAEKQRVAG